jgi:cobalt-precorrin-5B (C1)-methyltransferase
MALMDPLRSPAADPAIDPVTGFRVPPSWIEICQDPQAREKIREGRWVLLSSGLLLRRGLTTGTTAAAACKGAVLSLQGPVKSVDIETPAGIRVTLPVIANEGFCVAIKDAGDHEFDVTKGVEIMASANPSARVELVAGEGVGRIMAPGLCEDPGKPAISRSARLQILKAIHEGLEDTGLEGARVELMVPKGEALAEKTFNPRLGILGGISILGSTGFVEPWNEHLVESREDEMRRAKKVVATTGRTGLKFSRILFPDHFAVLIGSHLDRLTFEEHQDSILCGLPALILKWAWPEVLESTGCRTVAELVEKEPGHRNIALALERAKRRLPKTRIVLLRKDGSILRDES